MKVFVKKDIKGEFEEVVIKEGATLEDIARRFQQDLPYRILACKVDNEFKSLDRHFKAGSYIELLDMRTQVANLIYQNSLSLIFLKAVSEILGNVTCDIENSINKGLYTEIKGCKRVTEEDVENIEKRMEEIVSTDFPILRETLSPEEAIEYFKKTGMKENVHLISENRKDPVEFYTIDGYKGFFYSLMVPSTKYIEYFQLKKYRNGILVRFPHPSNPKVIPDYVDETVLYRSFGEQNRWGKLMGINYVYDLNKKIRQGKAKELIQLSEALHEQKIIEIAHMIKKSGKRIILIAGPSSSGKTTFAQRLRIQLRVQGLNPLYLGTDDYFVERENTPLDENGERNFEDIEAVDLELFNRNMNELLSGKEADLPTFDFITGHKAFGHRKTRINPEEPIIIEGIHALNERLTKDISKNEKFKIYISPLTSLNLDSHNRIVTTDHRMLRRMVRDYKYRDHSAEDTIATWQSVRKGEDKNIFPYSNEADIMFNSVHLYEICVLKKYAKPLLTNITKNMKEYGDAKRMLRFLDFFETIEDDRTISNNSILREFIGGSIFV